MVQRTTEALLSYSSIKNRADQLVEEFKESTLGEHADKALILAPILTGRVEFNALKVNFYYNHRSNQEAGIRYRVNF